jgi:hypothetical protein
VKINIVRLHRQISGDKAYAGEQLTQASLDLRDHAAVVRPALRLILEVLEKPVDLGQRLPPHRARQLMRDLLAQDIVVGQPDGADVTRSTRCRD